MPIHSGLRSLIADHRSGALGATGDIEQGNYVVSINGIQIQTGSTAPSSTVGDWKVGDLYLDTTVTPGRIWMFQGSAWVKLFPAQGVAIASANTLVPGTDGNVFHVTGATQINLISTTNIQGGSQITLIFDSNPVVKYNQAPSGVNKPVLLNGAADFATAANNTLTLVYDTTNAVWYEIGRKA